LPLQTGQEENIMPELSRKENYLRALRHETYEYVPIGSFLDEDIQMCGFFTAIDQGVPDTDFRDGYGVRWTASESAVGAMIPAPGEFLLKDVTRWKTEISLPVLGGRDWQKVVEAEYAMTHPVPEKALVFTSSTGVWERLAALMGFEEAMIAMIEEPDAVNDLFTAITDVKIKTAEIAAQCYHADIFVMLDDIATERNLFMSPGTYRKLIKPHHKRLNDAIKNYGMIPVQHTCGYAETCVEDYIETGTAAWNFVQPSNNIATLLDRYGDRFCFEGGFDTTGKPGHPDAAPEEIQAEVERCFRDYGKKKGYVFTGYILASVNSETAPERLAAMVDTANRLRFAGK
jgi:uroporphyrinogen-III decarboxylase